MHTHSRYSDGAFWPDQLAAQAKKLGIQTLCLTDHDTMGGIPEFLQAAEALGLRAWPAVEIDCVDSALSYKSEILAYFPRGSYSHTAEFLAANRKERAKNIKKVCNRAQELFHKPQLAFEELIQRKLAGKPSDKDIDPSQIRFAKTDIYMALKTAAIIPSTMEYRDFKRAYFDTGIFSDIKFPKTSVEGIMAVIKADKGVSVIPHIGHEFDDDLRTMEKNLDKLDSMLQRFFLLGVRGVELYHYRKDKAKAINELVRQRAQRFGYFFTYGSDCHGPNSGKYTLGQFNGEFDGFPPHSES